MQSTSAGTVECVLLFKSSLHNLYIYDVHTISLHTFFVWVLYLIVHTWNLSPLRSNLLRLQCTCTVPTTSGSPHRSPLVWACQWPSSQPLSSPQLSHNDREKPKVKGSKVLTIGSLRNCLDAHLSQIVCDKDGVVDWCIVLLEMPLTRFEECWPLP